MPTRYLKPGIRDSERIDMLSPLAETLFYRLLVSVDDFGRSDARPAMVKAACFPIKESVSATDCQKLLEELADAGLIEVYTVDGKPYLQMQRWENTPRAKESKYPAATDSRAQMHASVCKPRTVLPVTETETETETDIREPEAGKPAARKRAMSVSDLEAEGVESQHAADWLVIRKAKNLPLTATAWGAVKAQAKEAGMTPGQAVKLAVEQSWAGFKSSWVAAVVPPKPPPDELERYRNEKPQTPEDRARVEEIRARMKGAVKRVA